MIYWKDARQFLRFLTILKNNMAKTPAGSSALFRAAFLVLTLSFILLIIGYTTPNWTEIVIGDVLGSRTGLWKTCTEVFGGEETCGESTYDDESWFVIVRTFVTVGLACFILVLLISLLLLVVVSNQRLARVNIYTCIFTVLFITIGSATFTYRTEFDHLGYSCWLSWFSVAALVVATILLECARKKIDRREMTLTHVDVVSEETAGYHSYPMQDLSTKHTDGTENPVVHHSDNLAQADAENSKQEIFLMKKQ